MRYDSDGGRGSEVVHPCLLIIQLGIQLLLRKGNSEVSEVIEVHVPSILSIQASAGFQ